MASDVALSGIRDFSRPGKSANVTVGESRAMTRNGIFLHVTAHSFNNIAYAPVPSAKLHIVVYSGCLAGDVDLQGAPALHGGKGQARMAHSLSPCTIATPKYSHWQCQPGPMPSSPTYSTAQR